MRFTFSIRSLVFAGSLAAFTACSPPAMMTPLDSGPSCPSGQHLCEAACVANNAVTSCGTSCMPCSAPRHGHATCDGTTCGAICDAGYIADDAIPCVPDLRLIAPISSYRVTGRRPLLAWSGAADDDEIRVELCADRACASSIGVIDATGRNATPAMDLPTGPVFWRVRGRDGTTLAQHVTPTWEMFVGHGTAAAGRVGGPVLDLNGDGYVDLAVLRDDHVDIHLGGSTGLASTPSFAFTGTGDGYSDAIGAAGDVNGDGFGDFVVGRTVDNSVFVFHGRADIAAMRPSQTVLGMTLRQIGREPRGIGDTDGDGYGEIATVSNGSGGVAVVYGSATGLSMRQTTFTGPWWFAAGDVNGDGLSDLVTDVDDLHRTGAVYSGTSAGVATTPSMMLTGADDLADATLDGDVNGDGFPDLVTTPNLGSDFGVHLGGAIMLAAAPIEFTATIDSSPYRHLAANGDANGDGFDDVFVGAVDHAGNGMTQAGGAYVILGGAATLVQPATYLAEGTQDVSYLGSHVSIMGDTDGDGFDDLAVSAPNAPASGMQGAGQAFVFRGGATISMTPSLTIGGTSSDNISGIAAVVRPRRRASTAARGRTNSDSPTAPIAARTHPREAAPPA